MIYWFYSTWLGGKYLEFLLWLDEQNNSDRGVLSTKEVHQIVIQAQQMAYREGMSRMKKRVHELVEAKTTEEYKKALQKVENLIDLARTEESDLTNLREALYKAYVRTSGKDISNATEHAKMINKRISDYKELHSHQEKRNMLRDIRKLRREGKDSDALELEQQFKERYARRR